MKTGIYKIENLINHHIYVGQSVNIEKRWKREKQIAFLKNSEGYNYPLSRAFRKYGIENFSFEIIEECPVLQLNEREKYWIQYYNSFYNGYNQTLGGEGSSGGQPKEKIIGVIQDLLTTDMKHREIAKKWQVSIEMVQGINTGRYWFQDNFVYPLQERCKQKEKVISVCSICGVLVYPGSTLCPVCTCKKQRKVERSSREELKNLIRKLPFTTIAKQYQVSDNAVRKWCDFYKLPRQKYIINNISDEKWSEV